MWELWDSLDRYTLAVFTTKKAAESALEFLKEHAVMGKVVYDGFHLRIEDILIISVPLWEDAKVGK